MKDGGKIRDDGDGNPARRRRGRPLTAARLEKAALAYLQRFATSKANFRQVMMRRVTRSARLHGTDPEEGAEWVDALIDRYESAGLLDDKSFAEARVQTLRARGGSARAIRAKLAAKGVPAPLVERALAAAAKDGPGGGGDADLAAAMAYARRRRLGPWRAAEARAERRERDLAALARAGFGYDLARRVIDAPDTAAAEALLDET